MRVAAIDIGTNSVLLLIAERRDGVLSTVVDRASITRLGAGVDRDGKLDPTAQERTLACLADYASAAREHGAQAVAAVGTSALRDAQRDPVFLERASKLLGVAPQVISGAEEARLTFTGSLSGLRLSGPVTVVDVGGGSTEIIHGTAGTDPEPRVAQSLQIGSVRAFERYVRHDPPTSEELAASASEIDALLAPLPTASGSTLVGVAGTVTTLAALSASIEPYDSARVHGMTLSRDTVSELFVALAAMDVKARRAQRGLDPMRADVIVNGAQIVDRVLAWAGATALVVSDRGVRWGLAEELLQD